MSPISTKRLLRQACALILFAVTPSNGLAKSTVMTDGLTQLRVTDDPVQRRCVVITSSGVHETDQQACKRALSAIPNNFSGLPEGTYLFPDRDRRYARGTCVYPNGKRQLIEGEAVCSQLLNSMGNARVAMAIDPENWIRPKDLKGVPGKRRPIAVSVGVSPTGKATYCTVVRTSENALLDASVCQAISQRAKFDPALDKDGRPIPSAYDRQWAF